MADYEVLGRISTTARLLSSCRDSRNERTALKNMYPMSLGTTYVFQNIISQCYENRSRHSFAQNYGLREQAAENHAHMTSRTIDHRNVYRILQLVDHYATVPTTHKHTRMRINEFAHISL
jgi:hypothetical protein